MFRIVLLLPLTLAACAQSISRPSPAASRPILERVRPTGVHDLQGRWAIISMNGRQSPGLWLELGGEGLATITTTNTAVFVASPQPRTQAFLGCNDWHPNGWTLQGDTLTFGTEMSHRTERGCDVATTALDDKAYAILRKPMTLDFTPPNRLRLGNDSGTLELVRPFTERAATAFIEQNIRAGALLSNAVNVLFRGGFACRRLDRNEYGPAGSDGLGLKGLKMVMCYVAVERAALGYQLVYASLSADQQDRLVSVSAGSYPVSYRAIRVDAYGRVSVVRDPPQ